MQNLIHPTSDVQPSPSAKEISISKESYSIRNQISSQSCSLVNKVEYFEDIMNIEVGDTPLTRLRNIERTHSLRQIYAKFEGGNPTGTQKDRIAFSQCHDAIRRDFETISVATCGNYGAALSVAAYLACLKCVIFIPESFHSKRITQMEDFGANVIRVPLSYEDTVEYSIKQSDENQWYDANPGGVNTTLQLLAYAEIAYEIYDSLRDAPKYVCIPVSNGTLLAGVYRGFASLYKRGRTSRIPKIIAGSSAKKNPIIHSFRQDLDTCIDLDPKTIKETRVNEPLINWHSFDGNDALNALYQSKGAAYGISDEKMLAFTKILKDKEGLRVLPASTAGLAALLAFHEEGALEYDRFVVIITGKQ